MDRIPLTTLGQSIGREHHPFGGTEGSQIMESQCKEVTSEDKER